MRQPLEIKHAFLKRANLHIAYRTYSFPECKTGRRLLCLHGAGVAGETTFGFILPFLRGWSEVLVPDLRGMGETRFEDGTERPFSTDLLMHDQVALLDRLGWGEFDLCGYSLGGLVAMQLKQLLGSRIKKTYLIEPALLDNQNFDLTRSFRHQYKTVAKRLFSDTDKRAALIGFLDLVSPNRLRSETSEAMVLSRLGHRPVGFACALNAVSEAVDRVDRDALLAAQHDVISFVGGKSHEPMKLYHAYLAEQRADWQTVEVPGADHTLPFQKPKRIIQVMNESMAVTD